MSSFPAPSQLFYNNRYSPCRDIITPSDTLALAQNPVFKDGFKILGGQTCFVGMHGDERKFRTHRCSILVVSVGCGSLPPNPNFHPMPKCFYCRQLPELSEERLKVLTAELVEQGLLKGRRQAYTLEALHEALAPCEEDELTSHWSAMPPF